MIVSCIFIKNEILSVGDKSNCRFNFTEKNLIDNRISVDNAQLIHNIFLGIGTLLILVTSWMNIITIGLVYYLWTSMKSENYFTQLGYNVIIAFLLIFSGWLYAGGSLINILQCLVFSSPYILLFISTMTLIDFSEDKSNTFLATAFIIIGFSVFTRNYDFKYVP